jgi:hypothetical protein
LLRLETVGDDNVIMASCKEICGRMQGLKPANPGLFIILLINTNNLSILRTEEHTRNIAESGWMIKLLIVDLLETGPAILGTRTSQCKIRPERNQYLESFSCFQEEACIRSLI